MSASEVDLTAIIVNYNTKHLLRACLEALRASAEGLQLQTIVVDNASRDGSANVLAAECPGCELIFNKTNIGFGRANNQALLLARGRHVLLLNTDAFVAADTIRQTVRYLDEHPACGVLGVRLVGRDGSLQPSCRYFPTPWNEFLSSTGLARLFPSAKLVDDMAWDHATPRRCDWVPGCYYLVRKSVIDQVGLFDPRFFLYFEEVDHCRAVAAAGWQVMYFGGTTVVHLGGESAQSDAELTPTGRQISALQTESSLLYFRKHHGRVGVWAAAVLATLADAVLAMKWVVRRRSISLPPQSWSQSAATWAIMRRTDFGCRPTR